MEKRGKLVPVQIEQAMDQGCRGPEILAWDACAMQVVCNCHELLKGSLTSPVVVAAFVVVTCKRFQQCRQSFQAISRCNTAIVSSNLVRHGVPSMASAARAGM